ncbi:hypothetical protein FNV43_RR02436 [Rhamnella rubrinervis]|uniref:Pentatricopeptide repeat-containing protein n=1 Tax=Rhamnella rubrinervis TaxID=2594499 RepID=A0A8K0MT82_9ROSA|nr:hypothetical protein FNV43_RR02436 [Rhamnella rubrinervis]
MSKPSIDLTYPSLIRPNPAPPRVNPALPLSSSSPELPLEVIELRRRWVSYKKWLIEGISPDWFRYTTLVNGLCKAGHVKHALEIMDVMLQEGFDPDTFTCNSLIFGLRKLGEVKDVGF